MKKGNSGFATRSLLWSLSALFFGAFFAGSSFAWVNPEHRDIAVLAIQKLSAGQRTVLDRFWAEARTGREERLCDKAADAAQAEKPSCID